ncbi:MAG TPA: hypothetical protein VMJ10_15650 [Kofleriaceae bacterium]|nr:hypothetical protein [Kofleriaceae bacterium]
MWVSLAWISSAAADPEPPPSDECAQVARAETAPSPATEVAVGDCYTRAGNAAQAASWYRDAARRLMPGEPPSSALVLAAAPDHRDSWRVAMWSSFAVAAVGVGMYIHGRAEMNDATSQLCAGGAYASNPSCGYNQGGALTYAQVAQLNAQGEDGQTWARLGLGTALVAGGVGAYALYRGYFGHESRVVVAPVVAPGTGGAQLSLRW